MATASPIKQDRLERHLSRQRGAGVRDLATTFGFTFGAGIKIVGDGHERPAKRTKLETTTNGTEDGPKSGTSGHVPKVQHPRKARRLFQDIEEGEKKDILKTAAKDDSLVLTKKASKKKGISEAVQEKSVSDKILPLVTLDNAPSRRPRRQAATAARDKVSQGFIEESQPVDKLRRGQTAAPHARRSNKTVAASVQSKDCQAVDSAKLEQEEESKPKVDEILAGSEKQGKVDKKLQRPVRKAVDQNTSKIANTKRVASKVTRVPLAENNNKSNTLSISPEKTFNALKDDPTEPIERKPQETKRAVKSSVEGNESLAGTRERSSTKAVASQNELASKRDQPESLKDQSSTEGAVKAEAVKAVVPQVRKTNHSSRTGKAAKQPTVSQNTDLRDIATRETRLENADVAIEPKPGAKQRPANFTATEICTKSTLGVGGGEDMDWLFEKPKARKKPVARAQRRPAQSALVKTQLEFDGDLDDLLSTISSFVPSGKSVPSRKG